MFIIIGGDGKEYGPVTAEQVRAWMAAGRANLDTRAKSLGSEEWRRLGDFAEFAGPGSAPPMMEPAAAAVATAPAGTAVTPSVVPADRGMRLVARLVDWVIEFICAIPGGMILGPELGKIMMAFMQGKGLDLEDIDMQRVVLGGVVLLGTWLALLVVQVWLLATRGQSIGKIVARVRIVRFADNSRPGIVHAWLIREAAITAIGVVLGFFPFIGVLLRPAFHLTDWCLIFREDARCLHDLMAGTKVVKA